MAQQILPLETPQHSADVSIVQQFVMALRMLLVLTLILGVLYPLALTIFGQLVFPAQANGSLETVNNVIVGSSLIGQMNSDPRYFQGRPSAVNAMDDSYFKSGDDKSLGSSGASNLSPASAALQTAVQQRETDFRAFNKLPADAVVPPDMLFASSSGLDPHISPQAAALQVARVAEARGVSVDNVQALVSTATEGPQFGLFGQPRVNVLELNLALDRAS